MLIRGEGDGGTITSVGSWDGCGCDCDYQLLRVKLISVHSGGLAACAGSEGGGVV